MLEERLSWHRSDLKPLCFKTAVFFAESSGQCLLRLLSTWSYSHLVCSYAASVCLQQCLRLVLLGCLESVLIVSCLTRSWMDAHDEGRPTPWHLSYSRGWARSIGCREHRRLHCSSCHQQSLISDYALGYEGWGGRATPCNQALQSEIESARQSSLNLFRLRACCCRLLRFN